MEKLAPGRGYLDLRGVLTPAAAAAALKVGYRPTSYLTAYAEGRLEYRWDGRPTGYAGAGVRLEF